MKTWDTGGKFSTKRISGAANTTGAAKQSTRNIKDGGGRLCECMPSKEQSQQANPQYAEKPLSELIDTYEKAAAHLTQTRLCRGRVR
jgi:hypothetical protein